MRVIQCQTPVFQSKQQNLLQMAQYMAEVEDAHPDLVMFGEMFTCPYQTENFPVYAEEEGGESWQIFSSLAKRYKTYLAAGSIPELGKDGKVYNTAYVFNREGEMIAKHRKMHLFDIDVKGGQTFRESDTLTAGDQITTFDTEFGKAGLAICFDLRFPELFRMMALEGVDFILVPAAFNTTTGPLHWDTLFKCRALDNQCYIIGTSVARDPSASYQAYGHSLIADPWGKIVRELDEKEGILGNDIDLGRCIEVREQIPVLKARRTDLYEIRESRK